MKSTRLRVLLPLVLDFLKLAAMSMDDFSRAGFTAPAPTSLLCRTFRFAPWGQRIRITVRLGDHIRVTGGALRNWFIAQLQDSLAVGILWLIGLHLLKVPWAPLWASLAAILQCVPHLGPVLGLIGPVLAATVHWTDWQHPLYVLMMYAGIALLDGFLLQPYLMKRTAKVPMWASILTPIVLGILIPFWGVLLAPPLLAVVYAYRAKAAH